MSAIHRRSRPVTHKPFPPIQPFSVSPSQRVAWSPRVASAICPGLGQLLTGRLLSAVLHLVLFLAASSYCAVSAVVWVFRYVNSGKAAVSGLQAGVAALQDAPWLQIIAGMSSAAAVYLWSVYDARSANTRAATSL